MNYLSVEQLSKAYGEQELFGPVSFGLSKGDKVALVARNGTGKSTLLRILADKEEADSGDFSFRRDIRISFLEQEPELEGHLRIESLIRTANTHVLGAKQEYERLLEQSGEDHSPAMARKLETATAEMDRLHAWDYERRLTELLDLFRIRDLDQVVSSLSGGEKKRLALAMVLLDEPDLLILDEPTNHLDIAMIEWLEEYLERSTLTLLMVTHDRYFLERVCNGIMEMNRGELYHYRGSYSDFLEKREAREENRRVETHRAGQLMKKELEWVRRMPKARTTKSKSRIDAFDELKEKARVVKDEGELVLSVKTPRMGGNIMDVQGISKSYEQQSILKPFSYKFNRDDRIGIVGPNGSGKTTLLNLIAGQERSDSGSVEVGETIVMAYYRQMHPEWDPLLRVIDVVTEIAEIVHLANGRTVSASKFLEYFMFSPEAQYKRVESLSGGERRRLHLLTTLIRNPNFLILDEPTNDLDLFALARLEEFLLGFKGILVLVSHDRFFLDKLCDHLFILEGEGKVRDYYLSYSSWRLEQDARPSTKVSSEGKEEPASTAPASAKKGSAEKALTKTKLTYREKLEYEGLEPAIEALEEEKAGLEARLASGEAGYEEMEKLGSRITELMEEIDRLTDRWMELDGFA